MFTPRISNREFFNGVGTVLYFGCDGGYMNLYMIENFIELCTHENECRFKKLWKLNKGQLTVI